MLLTHLPHTRTSIPLSTLLKASRSFAMVHSPSPSPLPYQSHIERTASSPRDFGLHPVSISSILHVNPKVRLFRLRIDDQARGVKFLPGQWLDVFVPGLPKPGGFTITSAPLHAVPRSLHNTPEPPLHAISTPETSTSKENEDAYLELAIQDSPSNPPAAWLWRDEAALLGAQLLVRVGGNFVWPPPGIQRPPKNLLLVAGGVGINPLISILTHLHLTSSMPSRVTFLYSTKLSSSSLTTTTITTTTTPSPILFLDRLLSIASHYPSSTTTPTTPSSAPPPTCQFQFHLHLTPTPSHVFPPLPSLPPNTTLHTRRIHPTDLSTALGDLEARRDTVCYACGPRGMTDEIVEVLRGMEGVRGEGVLCEKWW